MRQEDITKVLEVGVLLSSERDLNRLLERALNCVVDLARCDAGTLYLVDGDALHFKVMRNDTLGTHSGGDGAAPDLPPAALTRENVCALAFLEGRTVSIDDVYRSGSFDFSGPKRYDAITGYRTKSMLVVPMKGREGEKIGVIQLINALDANGEVTAFPPDMPLVLEAVASMAAVTIQNVRYIEKIRELFRSFVRMLSAAVDERTPYNASHTRHMAEYGERFIDYLDREGIERFDGRRRQELVTSIWLHDIGKLVTPLEVMNKAARLSPEQHTAFLHRMEVVRLTARIEHMSGKISEKELAELTDDTRAAEKLVEEADTAGFQTDERIRALEALHLRRCTGEDGAELTWLTDDELEMLSIRRGTLSDSERRTMERHVELTDSLLGRISFPEELSHAREWASGHHELLDGSGYPRRLKAEDIPTEVRIITILDIFDALVASDRPYKKGMPVERALDILRDMAHKEGKLDPRLTEAFIAGRCWEEKA